MSSAVPLHLEHPLDIDEARRASRRLAELRRSAEQEHRDQIDKAAEAERDYRKGYARALVKAVGIGVEREAVAKAEVADLSYKRDLARDMVKACSERLAGLDGERSMLKSLIEWSARVDSGVAPGTPEQWNREAPQTGSQPQWSRSAA